jgi:predicted O-methyltransferase YrrM
LLNDNGVITCIDPFNISAAVIDRFNFNIELFKKHNPSKSIDVIITKSFEGLSNLIAIEKKFDLIYLDGSHKTEDVFSDLILSTFLLNDKGLIIVDDYSMLIKEHGICPKQAVDIFISLYKNKYNFTINDRDQAYFKLM